MKRAIIKRLAGIGFGLLVAVVITEVMARVLVAQGTLPNRMPADLFAAHAIGWTLEPGLHAAIFSTNGLVEVEINKAGFRDRDYPYAKTEGRTRVLVLGDSFTLALETPQAETFHTLLEARTGAEVIAMAASGYETQQEYLAYQYIGRDYEPDVVLLVMYVGNDLVGNTRRLDLPHYALNGDGTLSLQGYPYTGAFNLPLVTGQRSTFLMRHSMLAFIAGNLFRSRELNPVRDEDLCDYQIAENYPDPQPDDWALTEALLLALRDSVEAEGSQFRVVVVPMEFQVEQGYLDEFLNECEKPDWAAETPFQTRLMAFLAEHDIAALDLLPVLRAQRESGSDALYLAGSDIHWTAEGHVVVAETLAHWLDLE
jgi:hypothetical protein